MATLYISEYEAMPAASGNLVQAPMESSLAEQAVAIGGTSTQSSAFHARTQFVRVHTDVICSIKFGTNPTAVATEKRMAAGSTEFFGVPKGASFKVAVITNT